MELGTILELNPKQLLALKSRSFGRSTKNQSYIYSYITNWWCDVPI